MKNLVKIRELFKPHKFFSKEYIVECSVKSTVFTYLDEQNLTANYNVYDLSGNTLPHDDACKIYNQWREKTDRDIGYLSIHGNQISDRLRKDIQQFSDRKCFKITTTPFFDEDEEESMLFVLKV